MYDCKFPSERAELERLFIYLGTLGVGSFRAAVSAFAQLKLGREVEQSDWVNSPGVFSEQLSAHLWATRQIEAFRAAAVDYVQKVSGSAPDPALPTHRLGIAVIGQGVAKNDYPLFRKLSVRRSVYFTTGEARRAELKVLLDAVATRAKAHPVPIWRHWYIDGGAEHCGSGWCDANFVQRAGRAPRDAAEPHAENLRGCGFRSRGVSHHAREAQAGGSGAQLEWRRCAEPFPAQSADRGVGNAGFFDDLCAMGCARSAAARALTADDVHALRAAAARGGIR